jgi:flavin-dependent dehydrogenase
VGGEPPTPCESTAASLPPEPAWFARGFALEATVPFHDLPPRLPAGDQPHDLVFDFSPISGGYGWLFPKGDHINIGIGGFVPQSAFNPGAPSSATASSSPEVGLQEAPSSTTFYETVTRNLLAGYTRAKLGVDLPAHVTGQHLGLGGHAYVPTGRVLLAGDAAGLVDPLTGEGIHSAIVSGQAAAAAILQTLAPDSRSRLGAAGSDSRSSRGAPGPDSRTLASGSEADALATAYSRHLQPLQETLAFSYRAARSFYREPGRGMRAMRNPILRPLILKTYADGLPQTELIARLSKAVV